MKVLLVTKASGDNYSVEAGMADNVKHFDHHGEHASYPAPSNNPAIPKLGPNDVVEITHVDTDTLLGLMRMAGKAIPSNLDLELIEKVDLNGSSVVKDRTNESYLYMVGVNEKAKQINFPPPSAQPTDVTGKITQLMDAPVQELTKLGREASANAEATYENNRVESNGTVGLWATGADEPFDPSRPYADGVDVVVTYRDDFKSISIFCSPSSDYAFGNTTVAGIPFAGHPKACGSPRGEKFTLEDAKRVYEELVNKTGSSKSAGYVEFRGALYRKREK